MQWLLCSGCFEPVLSEKSGGRSECRNRVDPVHPRCEHPERGGKRWNYIEKHEQFMVSLSFGMDGTGLWDKVLVKGGFAATTATAAAKTILQRYTQIDKNGNNESQQNKIEKR